MGFRRSNSEEGAARKKKRRRPLQCSTVARFHTEIKFPILETQSQRTSLHFRPTALQFARGRVGVNRRIGLTGRIACFSRRVSQSYFSAPIYRSILGYPPLINQQRKTEDIRYPQLIYLMQTCPRVTPVHLKLKYPIIIMKPTFYKHRPRLWDNLTCILGQCLRIYYHHCIMTKETLTEGSFSTVFRQNVKKAHSSTMRESV